MAAGPRWRCAVARNSRGDTVRPVTAHETLELGFSSCPNDTFMFHALVQGRIETQGMGFSVWMEDIEALNARARGVTALPALPITKVSAAALGELTERYTVLDAGAALGFGCGPLVLRRAEDGRSTELASLKDKTVAIPGEKTTANLLFRIFGPTHRAVPMRFDAIMPAVAAGEVDAGLVIHESRFTFADHGLAQVADLGDLWERDTGLPLPLGVIVADRELPEAVIDAAERALASSVRHARAHPDDSRDYVRAHAQEMSEDVCARHIELYVNAFSESLGDQGRAAIDVLLRRGREAGFLPPGNSSPWRRL